MTKQIIVIGRGHSGTRIPMEVFQDSGVFMGQVNNSGDHLPPYAMYRAARQFGQFVKVLHWDYTMPRPSLPEELLGRVYHIGYDWDFSTVLQMEPTEPYIEAVMQYVKEFWRHGLYAWKLPEATLSIPWLVQVFPDAYYIHWVRDGRDNILRWHGTEDTWYQVPVENLPEDRLMRAALSWDYHEELIAQTPKPARWLRVRLEDYLSDQVYELERMSEFVGVPLEEVWVNPNVAGRYKAHDLTPYLPILERHLEAHGYLRKETVQS